MIKPKLEMQRLSDNELEQLAARINSQMTANAAKFPGSAATLATLPAKLKTFADTNQAATNGKQTWQALVATKDTARAAIEDCLRTLASQVSDVAKGQAFLILDAGMNTTSEGTPITMVPVTEMSATAGDHEGEINWMCHQQKGAIFLLQTSPDVMPQVWTPREASKSSSGTIGGLPSLTRVWVRACAKGSHNTGGWSNPASAIVP